MEIPRELRAGDILLSEQQREAIELALNSSLSIILGGAGCGKTTLIEAIVHCFRESAMTLLCRMWSPPRPARLRATSPSAPGSRHARSTARLGKAQMQTFWMPFRGTASDWSSSMRRRWCPLEMLAGILNRVRRNCRVALLGDPNQLLSVGAGNVLSDLLTLGVPSICLQQ